MRALVRAALAACVACVPAGVAGDANVEGSLASFSRHPELAVFVQTGTEHFRGRVTLTVNGAGEARVERLDDRQSRNSSAKLASSRVDAFGRVLAQHHLTATRRSKLPRQPDDSPLVLAVHRGSESLFRADLWYGDRYADEDLGAMFDAADAIVRDVTAGDVSDAGTADDG